MTPVLLLSIGEWATNVTSAIAKSLSWAFELFSTLITYLFNFLFSVALQGIFIMLGTFFQGVLLYLLHFVDVFQDFFDIFAGTQTVKSNGNEMYLLDVFLTNDSVKQALIAVTFIGVAICFIFTIYSVAKSMGSYALEHQRPISHVLKTAMKSCIAFMIVPVIMFFGSQLSSAILVSTENAIIGVTGSDESPRLSTILFLSGTFGDDDEPDASFTTGKRADYFNGKKSIYNPAQYLVDFNMYPRLDLDNLKALGEDTKGLDKNTKKDLDADIIQSIFQSQTDATNVSKNAVKNMEYEKAKEQAEKEGKKVDESKKINTDFSLDDLSKNAKTFPNLFESLYNYPLVYIASIGVILIMLCSMFVFIRKIIELVILYVTSPLFVSTMPLDGGSTFKRWREMFIGKLFSGFGIVISMNLVMIFIPMVMSANFSFSNNIGLDITIKIVFVVGCMYAAWKSNTTILEVINPEVAAADRASAMVVAGMVKMAANTAKDAAMAAVTGGGSLAAKGVAKAAGSAAKGAASAAGNAAKGAAGGSGNAFTGGGGGLGNVAKIGKEMASSGGSNKKDDEEKK